MFQISNVFDNDYIDIVEIGDDIVDDEREFPDKTGNGGRKEIDWIEIPRFKDKDAIWGTSLFLGYQEIFHHDTGKRKFAVLVSNIL